MESPNWSFDLVIFSNAMSSYEALLEASFLSLFLVQLFYCLFLSFQVNDTSSYSIKTQIKVKDFIMEKVKEVYSIDIACFIFGAQRLMCQFDMIYSLKLINYLIIFSNHWNSHCAITTPTVIQSLVFNDNFFVFFFFLKFILKYHLKLIQFFV